MRNQHQRAGNVALLLVLALLPASPPTAAIPHTLLVIQVQGAVDVPYGTNGWPVLPGLPVQQQIAARSHVHARSFFFVHKCVWRGDVCSPARLLPPAAAEALSAVYSHRPYGGTPPVCATLWVAGGVDAVTACWCVVCVDVLGA